VRRGIALALLLAGCATVERAPRPEGAEAALPPAFALLDRERPRAGAPIDLLPTRDQAFVELERRARACARPLRSACRT
jgi:hypothetical protein